jgi:hypothetical protein
MASQRGEQQQQDPVALEKNPLIEEGLTSFAIYARTPP